MKDPSRAESWGLGEAEAKVGLRRLALGAIGALMLAGLLVGRTLQQGRAQLAESDSAFNRGALEESLSAARRAAVWVVPGAPHVDQAYARMRAIALGAEASGRRGLARRAWTAIRGAALESRTPLTPNTQRLDEANAQVARLLASKAQHRGYEDVTQTWLAQKYSERGAPLALAAMAGAGFLLMVLACTMQFRHVVQDRRWQPSTLVMLLLSSGFCFWVWAAIQA